MLQAVLNRATVAYAVDSRQLLHLLAAWTLAFVWCAVAIGQFRRRGWQ
jgi:hypothetical protein